MGRFPPIFPIALLLAAMTCACLGPVKPEGDVCRRLQHESPRVRVDAAIEAGNTRDNAAVPFLIDRLTDQDSTVRMFSAIALRKITGRDFGFVPWAGRDEQEEAVKRWRAWQKEKSE